VKKTKITILEGVENWNFIERKSLQADSTRRSVLSPVSVSFVQNSEHVIQGT
jgi:hypothetical protein